LKILQLASVMNFKYGQSASRTILCVMRLASLILSET